jgi:uncharacterized protein (TIGR00369 family)
LKPIPLNKQELNALIAQMPFNHHLGLSVSRVWSDGLTLECAIRETLRNGLGTLHGGVTATLVDVSIGLAVIGQLGGRPATTVELKVNYLRPATSGKVLARARIVKLGKTLVTGTTEVKDPHGHVIAIGAATYMPL